MPYIDPDASDPRLVAEIARQYELSAQRLKQIVLHPPGSTAGAVKFNQARAAQQLAQVQAEINRLKHTAAGWTSKAVRTAVEKGLATADAQARAAGILAGLGKEDPIAITWRKQASKMSTPKLYRTLDNAQKFGNKIPNTIDQIKARIINEELAKRGELHIPQPPAAPPNIAPRGSFNLVDRKVVEVLARDTVGDLIKAADSMQQQATFALRHMAATGVSNAEVNTILTGGIIEGKPKDTIRQLKEALEKVYKNKVTIQGKNGPMEFDTDYYARLVANAKTKEATAVARHERLREHGLDLITIIGTVSLNPCTLLLGKVFSLSGDSKKYPAFATVNEGQLPWHLFHPNCSKSTAPFIEGLASHAEQDIVAGKVPSQDTNQRLIEDIRARARAAGYAPPPHGQST